MKKINVLGAEIQEMQDFKYLGSYVSADSDIDIDTEISTTIDLAAQTFNRLQDVWKLPVIEKHTPDLKAQFFCGLENLEKQSGC